MPGCQSGNCRALQRLTQSPKGIMLMAHVAGIQKERVQPRAAAVLQGSVSISMQETEVLQMLHFVHSSLGEM